MKLQNNGQNFTPTSGHISHLHYECKQLFYLIRKRFQKVNNKKTKTRILQKQRGCITKVSLHQYSVQITEKLSFSFM